MPSRPELLINRDQICINCGTTKPCEHYSYLVLKSIDFTDLGCRKIEVCAMCEKVFYNPTAPHTFEHVPQNGFVNFPYPASNCCHRLERCSTCKFEHSETQNHKMFRQVCTLCGSSYKECNPCLTCDEGGAHCSVGVFSYLHKFNSDARCERCHITCNHLNKSTLKWITKDDKTCFAVSICDQCEIAVPVCFPAPHTLKDEICSDCGYQTPPYLKMVQHTKKACLTFVEDCFTKLETDLYLNFETKQ